MILAQPGQLDGRQPDDVPERRRGIDDAMRPILRVYANHADARALLRYLSEQDTTHHAPPGRIKSSSTHVADADLPT